MDLLNTHLESTAEHAEERTRQLEKCFEIMSKRPGDRTVIFGGDLNSRDKEVENINNILRRCHNVKIYYKAELKVYSGSPRRQFIIQFLVNN